MGFLLFLLLALFVMVSDDVEMQLEEYHGGAGQFDVVFLPSVHCHSVTSRDV
jgi:hypothetical protein